MDVVGIRFRKAWEIPRKTCKTKKIALKVSEHRCGVGVGQDPSKLKSVPCNKTESCMPEF